MAETTELEDLLSLEAYARVTAHLAHFRNHDPAEVIERLGVEPAVFEASLKAWSRALADELERKENTLVLAWSKSMEPTRAALLEARPSLASIGELRTKHAALSQAMNVTSPAARSDRAADSPSDRTVMFEPVKVSPPPAPERPRHAHPKATVLPPIIMPTSSARAMRVEVPLSPPRSAERAPAGHVVARGTVGPSAFSNEVALPFKASWPAPAVIQAGPARPRPDAWRGETVGPSDAPSAPALPFENARPIAPDDVDLSMFPIERYAAISAALASGEGRMEVLQRFVLTEPMWDALTKAWASRFAAAPGLGEHYRALVAHARRK